MRKKKGGVIADPAFATVDEETVVFLPSSAGWQGQPARNQEIPSEKYFREAVNCWLYPCNQVTIDNTQGWGMVTINDKSVPEKFDGLLAGRG